MHPRSTALLQKALEEARREGIPNGAEREGQGGVAKPVSVAAGTRSARAAHTTTKISQYGEIALVSHPHLCQMCVCQMCVCTAQRLGPDIKGGQNLHHKHQ